MQELTIGQVTIQRVTTIDTKGGGYAILLTTTNNIDDDVLVALMRGRGSVMKVTMERLQQALMDGDDVNAGLPPVTERVFETASGDTVFAHIFEGSLPDGTCAHCGHHTTHEAHQGIDKSGALADKLIEGLRDGAEIRGGIMLPDAPTDPDEDAHLDDITLEQQEARKALASRSRSARNGQ